MPELRWNPLLGTWTMVATNRQHRPHLPADYCPFCPSHHPALGNFEVLAYDNDFPVLSLDPASAATSAFPIFKSAKAYGKCEVILYSPDHTKQLYQLSDEHLLKLVNLWAERYRILSCDKRIQYIFEFENRGEEVGVTIHHPHGQLYAYSWIPPKIETELKQCRRYFLKYRRPLLLDLMQDEKKQATRMVYENKSFSAFIPYFTDYPFGLFVVSRSLRPDITRFTLSEKRDLADALKKITAAFDKVYDRPFPYMMCFHQTPVNSRKYADAGAYYSFHIEFYPPLRDRDKIKWYAGSEMGAGATANPMDVDECAKLLRSKIEMS